MTHNTQRIDALVMTVSQTLLGMVALMYSVLAAMLLLSVQPVQAQMAELTTSVVGMEATASFERSTPCTPYTLDWGDGEKEVVETPADTMCIQVIDAVELSHEYEAAGEYVISLTTSGNTYTNTVTIEGEVEPFALEDVETITYVWVDPSEMIADEEYYVYTITLVDDTVLTTKVAGFTTPEYRDAQFAKIGYTGDIDELLTQAEQVIDDTDDTPVVEEPERVELYEKIRSLLLQLVAKLQAAL